MKINPKYVSFYYQGMEEVPDMELDKKKTALLVIDSAGFPTTIGWIR